MLKKLISFIKPSKTKSFICTECGKVHEDYPSLAYSGPVYYSELNENERNEIAKLTSDTCIIDYSDQINRFIRVTLSQKINSNCKDLNYGFWVSLSEESFENYCSNFNNPDHKAGYFGWISNNLEGYENTLNIPVDIHTQPNGQRPGAVPHHDHNHPFVIDYYKGIPKEEAEKRINTIIKNTD